MTSVRDPRPLKPYSAPRLIVYGDVKHVTRSVMKNQNDDGGPKNFKT